MDASLAAIAGVPWQHWAILAAASWPFSLVCLIGFYRSRSRPRAAAGARLQLVQHDPPDDLRFEHDRLYHPRRAA